jgi:succinate dehydrogenase / fumarate reductase, iron-sulfur subunit|tara:strand:- start:4212 stop:4913 length:702 start_codon:yes stop_codon:yes gene_type:complete
MQFDIYRYDPDKDKKPYMQTYHLEREESQGIMLLDALETIKAKYDTSLSFRRSCGGGVCGSDGMNINGKNSLACTTMLKSLPDKVVIRPLPGMPVIRDLIVDVTNFFAQYAKAKPFLRPDVNKLTDKEMKQSPAERAKIDGLYECILCACCSSSCPSYWWNPDKFIGPAGLLWAARFLLDSRDNSSKQRLSELNDLFSLYRCRGIMNCTNVCPKGLNPAEAIAKVKAHHRISD